MEFVLSATVTLVTLGIYFRVLANVSKVRGKTNIWGPATSDRSNWNVQSEVKQI